VTGCGRPAFGTTSDAGPIPVALVWLVPRMYYACTTHVPRMHHACTTHVPRMHHACTSHVPRMYLACTSQPPPKHLARPWLDPGFGVVRYSLVNGSAKALEWPGCGFRLACRPELRTASALCSKLHGRGALQKHSGAGLEAVRCGSYKTLIARHLQRQYLASAATLGRLRTPDSVETA